MKALVVRPLAKFWRLVFFCMLSMIAALSLAVAEESPHPNPTRLFWVLDFQYSPPRQRLIHARLRSSIGRSTIYVEESALNNQVSDAQVTRLKEALEVKAPAGAYKPARGIIGLQESLFGPLPRRHDHPQELVVLFADLGQNRGARVEGLFHIFDQMDRDKAWHKYRQHSNQANIVYLNGNDRSEVSTTRVIARELQRMLAANATHVKKENWLAETLASAGMMLSGSFLDQNFVDLFARNTGLHQLVTPGAAQLGVQVLFASYLIDEVPQVAGTAAGFLTHTPLAGRDAVEHLIRQDSQTPLTFDVIFSNFVSYVFAHSEQNDRLPEAWDHNPGISVPKIDPYYTFTTVKGEFSGQLAPYSFVGIDLAQELSPSALIQVQKVPSANPPSNGCAQNASVLWKPIHPTRIAVYAVGCNPNGLNEMVQFRLKILDQPSLLPKSPLRIVP